MSLTHETSVIPDAGPVAPWRTLVARLRRVLIVALIGAALYPAFMSGSRGTCAGGVEADGGFIDSAGRPLDDAPPCIQLNLVASPLVYLGIGLIVLFAINRVIKAVDEEAALRTLDRAAIGVAALVFLAIFVSQVWFRLIPIADFMSGSFSVLSPFPFGFIEVTNSFLTAP